MTPCSLNKLNKWHCSWLSFMVFPLLLLFLWPLMLFPSTLTPSRVMGIRAGHTAPEELSSKPNAIYDILHVEHPTSILIFDHFSALTIIIHIHFIIHLIPQWVLVRVISLYKEVGWHPGKKSHRSWTHYITLCPQALTLHLFLPPVSWVTCPLSSRPAQHWLICSQATSGRGHEAKNSP